MKTINKLLRQRQVLEKVPFSKSTLWLRIKEGKFPQPLKISAKITVWKECEIDDYINSLSSGGGDEI